MNTRNLAFTAALASGSRRHDIVAVHTLAVLEQESHKSNWKGPEVPP